MDASVDWLLVALLGALVGMGELVGRYRDAPTRVVLTVPALLYIGLNVAAALGALALVQAFGWTFGMAGGSQPRWAQVLVAGLGAMAVLRSALFTLRVGDEDVAVGPSSFLQIILTATDQEVDRRRAQARAVIEGEIMAGVSFARAQEILATYCLALMQNLPDDDQRALGDDIKKLRDAPTIHDRTKARLLGLALMNRVGEDVLRAAVKALPEIQEAPPGGDAGTARSAPGQ